MPALAVLAHHSEPTDPVLLRWITDTIEAILGGGTATLVAGIAFVLVAFPITLGIMAMRQRRKGAGR